jgi:hypothetical protein
VLGLSAGHTIWREPPRIRDRLRELHQYAIEKGWGGMYLNLTPEQLLR